MLELLYATGIRVSELISLTLDDLNMTSGYIRVQEGSRERVIPFGSVAKQALKNYLSNARAGMIASDDENRFIYKLQRSAHEPSGLFGRYLSSMPSVQGSRRILHRIHSDIRLPRTLWKTARTCIRFRRCLAIPMFPQHRFMPGSPITGSEKFMPKRIQEHKRKAATSKVIKASFDVVFFYAIMINDAAVMPIG